MSDLANTISIEGERTGSYWLPNLEVWTEFFIHAEFLKSIILDVKYKTNFLEQQTSRVTQVILQ